MSTGAGESQRETVTDRERDNNNSQMAKARTSRGLLDPMTAEPGGHVKVFEGRVLPDDGILVQCVVVVIPCPRSHHLRGVCCRCCRCCCYVVVVVIVYDDGVGVVAVNQQSAMGQLWSTTVSV